MSLTRFSTVGGLLVVILLVASPVFAAPSVAQSTVGRQAQAKYEAVLSALRAEIAKALQGTDERGDAALAKATSYAQQEAAEKDFAPWLAEKEAGQKALAGRLVTPDAVKFAKTLSVTEQTVVYTKTPEFQSANALLTDARSVLSSDKLDAKLVKCDVLSDATPGGLDEFAKHGSEQAALVEKLPGDTAAQLKMAVRLRDGDGVAKDDVAAMQWAHRAADAGNADAMDFVGHAYLRGAAVKRNPGIAYAYFKAAASESAQAAFNLGQCYFGAQGTEQDCARALAWWTKAAAKGHGRAASTAAMALLSGEGVEPDEVEARRLAERAAELNDPSGLIVLGEMQFLADELDSAKVNWAKASKLHSTAATGHPAQPSGNASAQQGVDLLKLIEYRRRKSEPGKFAFLQMPHIHQGYNNCGSTACATFARFQGSKISGWDFKKLCPSPLGTGTDWWHLLDASAKIGQKWKLVTYTPDDAGFAQATAMLKSELDAGRPVVVDFKYIGPQYPGGSAGHTLNVCGYIAQENLYILCNPAVATPGLQLITATDLNNFWRSDYYGSRANAVLSRPAFVIEQASAATQQ